MKLNMLFVFILIVVSMSVPVTTAEYNHEEIKSIIYEAGKEIKPGFTEDFAWYVNDNEHVGLVYYSEVTLEPDMRDPGYWDMEQRMTVYETPDMIVSSAIVFDAPTPYGTRVFVNIDGYNLPLSELEPVAEVIFTTFVDASLKSGAIGEVVTEDTAVEEYDSFENTIPEDIPAITDDDAEYEEIESTEYDYEETDDYALEKEFDELFSEYDRLLSEGLIEYEGEMDVEDIDKRDIEDIQNINMNFILPEDFVEAMEQEAKIIDMIRDESSEDIDKLEGMDTGGEQGIEANRDIIKDVFGDDFNFEAGSSSVSVGGGPDYEGKEKVAEKLSENLYLDALDNTRKESMEKLKTGHEAASFFSDTYGDSKISKTFEKLDKLNSVKEEVDKYVDIYKDSEKLSEMKGSSGTAAKALYAVAKGGQEVADKIPVVGELVKTGFEVTEKLIMVVPELDNAIKNSDARQGVITNGPIGTSTPNAFLDSYGKVTQTSDGPSYSMPYTDENGQEHEISPDQWVKVTTKDGTYYIPTDEWENPIGDVALKDSGSSWKPWKWDNCQVVKRTNPGVTYNNGEEYDL